MKTNLDTIREVVEYIEAHLEERLDLDSLCKAAGSSGKEGFSPYSTQIFC